MSAAVSAGNKITQFFCCPFDALGATMATWAGQNVGARRLDRIDKGIKSCIIIGAVYSVIALAGLWLFSDVVALLFVDAAGD